MFTRVVELSSKSGKAKELSNTINEKVLPILKKQTGFVDEAVLVSDTESTRILGLSFWNSKEAAERYHRHNKRNQTRDGDLEVANINSSKGVRGDNRLILTAPDQVGGVLRAQPHAEQQDERCQDVEGKRCGHAPSVTAVL